RKKTSLRDRKRFARAAAFLAVVSMLGFSAATAFANSGPHVTVTAPTTLNPRPDPKPKPKPKPKPIQIAPVAPPPPQVLSQPAPPAPVTARPVSRPSRPAKRHRATRLKHGGRRAKTVRAAGRVPRDVRHPGGSRS